MISIFEYADIMNFELELRRYPNQAGRWTAMFRGVGTCSGPLAGTYTSAYGNGKSPGEAISDYLTKLVGQWLHVGAHIGSNGSTPSIVKFADGVEFKPGATS